MLQPFLLVLFYFLYYVLCSSFFLPNTLIWVKITGRELAVGTWVRFIFTGPQYGICFVTLPAPKFLRWLLHFCKNLCIPGPTTFSKEEIRTFWTQFLQKTRHQSQGSGITQKQKQETSQHKTKRHYRNSFVACSSSYAFDAEDSFWRANSRLWKWPQAFVSCQEQQIAPVWSCRLLCTSLWLCCTLNK